jgi:calcium-dependent protein kinase
MLDKVAINASEYMRNALKSEIKVMQKLRGSNVVRLLDFMETQNHYYLVEEFCDGGDYAG